MKKVAIVLAGGKGSRMKSEVPKQYMQLNGRPVLYYSLDVFEKSSIDEIILVSGPSEIEYCRCEIVDKYGFDKVTKIVPGGQERYHSVFNGLRAVLSKAVCMSEKIKTTAAYGSEQTVVLIHDGARPCISQEMIDRCLAETAKYHACVAAVPIKDTVKIADEAGFAQVTPDRSRVWQIQTPQVFDYSLIASAYEKMMSDPNRGNITDDAMVVEHYTSVKVKLTMGSYDNIKITTPGDLILAEQLLQ